MADTYNHMIKRVNIPTKSITPYLPVVGSALSYPRGTTVVDGAVYFADYGNHCVRKIPSNSNGVMHVVAGICGYGGYSGDGSQANFAQLFFPSSVVVDPLDGDLFIADSGNHVIRKVSMSGGIITTIAGIVGQANFAGENVAALDCHLYEPTDLVIGPNGDLYVSDHGNHCVRKIDLSGGIINSVAGQCGVSGFSGDDGLATDALLSSPRGLAFTRAGELLIADHGNSVIRKVDIETGKITRIAGDESTGYSGDGGMATSARMTLPTDIAVSNSGDYYVADFGNHLIRVVQPTHTCDGISNKDSQVCSGNGYCVATDECRCKSGYAGTHCSLLKCYDLLVTDPLVCSGNGLCVGPNNCTCYEGYENHNCSDVKCPDNGCLQIVESQPSDHQHCSVPTFNAQFPPEINVLNVTWILKQFEVDIETVETVIINSTYRYSPTVLYLYDGDYTVSAKMYYETKLGEVRLRAASIQRKANCGVCAPGFTYCRFTIGLDNQSLEQGKTVSIPRMTPFTIKLLDHDSLNNSQSIQRLDIQWVFAPSYKTQNIKIQQSDNLRELTISPTDSMVGMNQNVTIDIECRYKLPSQDNSWTAVIPFKIHTIPSKTIVLTNAFDISPLMGFASVTQFDLRAKGLESNPNITYAFSFHDSVDNVEIRLSQSKTPVIRSTLPTGSIPNFNLLMRLRVFDLVTGDSGMAEKAIIVKSHYGLLTQRLNDVIEQGGDYRELVSIASQVSVASREVVQEYMGDLEQIVNKMVNYTKSKTVIGQIDAVVIEQQMYVVDLITRNRLIVSEESKEASLDIVSLIIERNDPTTTSPIITNNAVQNMANIISNVVDGGFKEQNVAQKRCKRLSN